MLKYSHLIDPLQWAQLVLRSTPARWTSLAESLPEELLSYEPSPGEWSALSCLKHLVDTERHVFPARVGHFLIGQDFPAFNPDAEGSARQAGGDMGSMAEEFRRLRAESLIALGAVSRQDLERTAHHAELGLVSLGEMIHEWAAHDLNQTIQAERAMMQPFIAGSGPWEIYFKDHFITRR